MPYPQYVDSSRFTRRRNRDEEDERYEVGRINDDKMLKMGKTRRMSPVDQQAALDERSKVAGTAPDPRAFKLGGDVAPRNRPMASAGVANPPPIRYADPTAPRNNVGTPSRILGPNITPGETDPTKIAVALAQNRAAVAPGGMGTASYTGAAQASRPMEPTNFNMRPRGSGLGVVTEIEMGGVPGQTVTNENGVVTRRLPIPEQYRDKSDPNAPMEATSATATPDKWKFDLKEAHPNIFVEGTPENTQFVQAFKAAGQDPTKAMTIAEGVRNHVAQTTVPKTKAEQSGTVPSPAQQRAEQSAITQRMQNYKPNTPVLPKVSVASGVASEFSRNPGPIAGGLRAAGRFIAGRLPDPTVPRTALSPEELRKQRKRIPGATGG